MLGAIIGDIVGSRFEFKEFKSKDFELFHADCDYTDDSICTMATAEWLLGDDERTSEEYGVVLQRICRQFPHPMGGYGLSFAKWVKSDAPAPYGSYGNGSAMRVAPVGWAFDSFEETMEMAKRCAAVTHNHREGIKGAQAVATAIYWARQGESKPTIRQKLEELTGYNLNRSCDDIRPHYHFDETCQGTVPEAVIAFLDSEDFEDAIRLAISLGGDSDTLTCITGSIAEAYYGIPKAISDKALGYLPASFRQLYDDFAANFGGLKSGH